MPAFALPCPLRTLTGLDCPLCGATRATFSLLRGDLATALDFNALYVVLLPVLAVIVVLWFTRRRMPPLVRARAFPWVALAVAVIYTAIRNLPWEPFTYLGT